MTLFKARFWCSVLMAVQKLAWSNLKTPRKNLRNIAPWRTNSKKSSTLLPIAKLKCQILSSGSNEWTKVKRSLWLTYCRHFVQPIHPQRMTKSIVQLKGNFCKEYLCLYDEISSFSAKIRMLPKWLRKISSKPAETPLFICLFQPPQPMSILPLTSLLSVQFAPQPLHHPLPILPLMPSWCCHPNLMNKLKSQTWNWKHSKTKLMRWKANIRIPRPLNNTFSRTDNSAHVSRRIPSGNSHALLPSSNLVVFTNKIQIFAVIIAMARIISKEIASLSNSTTKHTNSRKTSGVRGRGSDRPSQSSSFDPSSQGEFRWRSATSPPSLADWKIKWATYWYAAGLWSHYLLPCQALFQFQSKPPNSLS